MLCIGSTIEAKWHILIELVACFCNLIKLLSFLHVLKNITAIDKFISGILTARSTWAKKIFGTIKWCVSNKHGLLVTDFTLVRSVVAVVGSVPNKLVTELPFEGRLY